MTTDDPGDVIELSVLWAKLRRSAGTIILLAVLCSAIGLLYTRVIAPQWEAGAILMMPDTSSIPMQSSLMANALGLQSGGGGGGAAAALGLTTKADPLDILRGMLGSRTAETRIARALHMPPEKVGRLLDEKTDKDTSELKITFQHRNKQLAVRAVTEAVAVLNDLCRQENSSSAARLARSLGQQRDKYQKDLDRTEAQILDYQTRMRTSPAPPSPGDTMLLSDYGSRLQDIEFQLRTVQQELSAARTMAHSIGSKAEALPTGLPTDAWRNRLLGLEYNLHQAELTGGPQSPTVVLARRTADLARNQLEEEIANYLRAVDLNVNSDVAPKVAQEMVLRWERDYVRSLMRAAPREIGELQQLLRKQAMQTAILATVQTETTKAEIDAEISSKDPLRFVVLDKPGLNYQNPVNKRWGLNAVIGAILGLIVGLWVAIRRPEPSPPKPKPEAA